MRPTDYLTAIALGLAAAAMTDGRPALAQPLNEAHGAWTLACDGFDDMGGVTYENCRITATPLLSPGIGTHAVIASLTLPDPARSHTVVVTLTEDALSARAAAVHVDGATVAEGPCTNGECAVSDDRMVLSTLADAGTVQVFVEAVRADGPVGGTTEAGFDPTGLADALAARSELLQ